MKLSIRKFTAKQCLFIMLSFGIIILLTIIYITSSQDVVVPTLPNQHSVEIIRSSNILVMPVENQGKQINQVIRDPFAVPKDYKEQLSIPDNFQNQIEHSLPTKSNNISTTIEKSSMPTKTTDLVRLIGIASTKDQYIAFIQTTTQSKAYYINEYVGTYQLVAILKDFVILKNNNKQLILPLEPAKLKGDNRE